MGQVAEVLKMTFKNKSPGSIESNQKAGCYVEIRSLAS